MHNRDEVKIRPVILSGNAGETLGPMSRDYSPRQFARLINNESLFSSTLRRVSNRNRYAAPLVIGNIEHTFFILETLQDLNITDAIVMVESVSRNTATAAIIAALHENEQDMPHLVIPSDHHIPDESAFHEAVSHGLNIAENGGIVLFGIPPAHPDTGCGYIIPGRNIDGAQVHEISVFTEKPNETFARILINQGALWNSGIFLYRSATVREEVKSIAPEHYRQCKQALDNAKHDKRCITLLYQDYEAMEGYSFETLIMEQTERGAVIPCPFGWSNIASWTSLWQIAETNKGTENANGSHVNSEAISIAAHGKEDVLIITTQDTVLVVPTSKAQDIKSIAPVMESKNNFHVNNKTSHYPWGAYKEIGRGDKFLVKHLIILPGCSISLQSHHHRSEHWFVISGKARAKCEGVEKTVLPNESVFIPQGTVQYLTNESDNDLQIIEVQSGTLASEDDSAKLEDLYNKS